jgi:hypothetical protein
MFPNFKVVLPAFPAKDKPRSGMRAARILARFPVALAIGAPAANFSRDEEFCQNTRKSGFGFGSIR